MTSRELPARSATEVATVPSRWRVAAVVFLAGFLITFVALATVVWNRRASSPLAAPTAGKSAGALAVFWRPFTSEVEAPWVIFSNAAFVGRPETGMRYYKSGADSKSAVYDHYTGVGEVLAIHALDDAFGAHGPQDIESSAGVCLRSTT